MKDQPPVFATWTQWYIAVLIAHAVIVCLCYWVTIQYPTN